jgi:N utilization substance protein A
MAKKATSKKKHSKSNRPAPKKARPVKKSAAGKKSKPKTNARGAKTARRKKARTVQKKVRGKSRTVDSVVFAPAGRAAPAAGQSGDLQGLSNAAGANSESVDELLEEGNAFEAEAVKGVEDAGDADAGEVRAHEVSQDDVPREYEDKD